MDASGIAKKGDKKIPHQVWNRVVRNVNDLEAGKYGIVANSVGVARDLDVITIKNTGLLLQAYSVVEITGIVFSPTGMSGAFQDTAAVTADIPSSNAVTTYAVTLEPIDAGKFGKAAASGIVPCRIDVSDASHKFAVAAQNSVRLASKNGGDSTIIWKESGTGLKWALVRLGSGGGVVLGTVSQTWNKGGTATVTPQKGDGTEISGASTFTAKNYFATVTVSGTPKRVACALIDSTWVLIAAEC